MHYLPLNWTQGAEGPFRFTTAFVRLFKTLWSEAMFIATLVARLNAWARYRETVRELQKLSDRELDDLGIGRAEIDAIAWRAAHA